MNVRNFTPRPLSAAIALLVAAAGAGSVAAGPVVAIDGLPRGPDDHVIADSSDTTPARYFVRFSEAPLALYDGSDAQLAPIPRATAKDGRRKLDTHSPQAQQYLAHLNGTQGLHLGSVSNALGRQIKTLRAMRHAINGVVVEMTPGEARKIAKLDGIAAVRKVGARVLTTDIGPQFIGATSVWTEPNVADDVFHAAFDGNMPAAHSSAALGDGVVVADLDTGYNSLSPSFAPTDDTGYTIQNPLGAGHYLGQCAWRSISDAGCNNKVIGVWDLTADAAGTVSVEDTQGHGSHTGSTAAGDSRSATIGAFSAHVSGVAPHANLEIFHVCAPAPANCGEDAIANAIDQAVADGVADVLNFSISGGTDPWNDIDSLAFLGAEAAGIFVAAAAGNTGADTPLPLPGTANHFEPWVTTVAAGTHTGGQVGYLLSVSGAGAPGPVGLIPAVSGTQLAAAFPATPIKVSPNYGEAGDGCSAYPAGAFTGAIALLKFDNSPPCNTDARAHNALLAGASAAILGSPTAQTILSGANQTIPVFTASGPDADQLAAYANAHPGSTGSIAYPANSRLPQQPDVLAGFSLLGPAWVDVMKPDVQAPGVSILAAVANDGTADGPDDVAFFDGTSMATPHTTGAAALLTGLHPDWTPMEIKSALMMTAKEAGLTKPDATTPSDFFDRGAGRIRVDVADKAGLVLDETAANMQAANPALAGSPGALNLASMQAGSCSSGATKTCAFTRTFRGTVNHAVTWTASYAGDAAMNVSIVPGTFSISDPAGTKAVTFNVNATGITATGAFHFGEVTLTPSDASLPKLHLPVAIAVQPPAISVDPPALAFSIPNTTTTLDQPLTVMNVGGPTLNVSDTNFSDATPQYAMVTIDQSDLSNYGAYSTLFTNFSNHGRYAADDFTVNDPSTNLGLISVQGFTTANTALSALGGAPLHFRIYHDAGGKPDGAPEAPALPPNNAPVWQFDTTIGHAGVDVTNDTVTLNLVQAGAPATSLPPGTFWLLVYPEMNSALSGGWASIMVNSGSGSAGMELSPTGAPTGVPVTNWTAFNAQAGVGLAMHIEQYVACGAPWLTTLPATLSLGGGASAPVTVTVDSSNFDGGVASETGYLCLKSNDAHTPTRVIRVTATQN
jgi:subtilisin family serine protease